MATLSMQKALAGDSPLTLRATRGDMMTDGSGRGEQSTACLTVRELADLDDGELLRIIRSLPRVNARRAGACEVLVARYRNLVRSCVLRYPPGPEPTEDLMQVGYIGLLKAINNFDPAVGRSLAAYAQPCVSGEIKRHFRDKRWHVHVERPTQELALRIRETTERLSQQLGHPPSDAELASSLGVSPDKLRRARMAELAREPWSLDARPAAGRRRPAWRKRWDTTTRTLSCRSTCRLSPPTGLSCPHASGGSWRCASTAI